MGKLFKLMLGILTVLPIFYLIFFIMNFVNFPDLGIDFDLMFDLHVAVIFLLFGLTIYYLIHIFSTKRLEGEQRILWAILFFVGNIMVYPVYWYLHIWSDPKKKIL